MLDLPGATERLSIWKADLAEEGSFDDAIKGCTGVFHVATPMDFESKDPEVVHRQSVSSQFLHETTSVRAELKIWRSGLAQKITDLTSCLVQKKILQCPLHYIESLNTCMEH